MSKIVAISGLGDDAPAPTDRMLLAWLFVFGTTVGIFVGTLALNPSRKKKA